MKELNQKPTAGLNLSLKKIAIRRRGHPG